MARFNHPLSHVSVASPCKSDWDQMIGSERMRFCGQCNLNVYNLSEMTRDEAEAIIAANEGRLCVRFYRRRDGSIITQDCPVGLRAVQQRLSYMMKAVVAVVLTFLASLGIHIILPDIFNRPGTFVTTGVMAVNDRPGPNLVGVTPEKFVRTEVGELVYVKGKRPVSRPVK